MSRFASFACILIFFCTSLPAGAGEEDCHDPYALKKEISHESGVTSLPFSAHENPFETDNQIISAIRALRDAKVPLNARNVFDDYKGLMRQALEKHVGFPVEPVDLYKAAGKRFGSWDRALVKAGLDLSTARRPPPVDYHAPAK